MRDEQVAGSRRAVLAAGTLGVVGGLAGCAVYGRPETAAPAPAPAGDAGVESPEPSAAPTATADGETPEPDPSADGGGDGGGPPAGTEVATTTDVAVGGGYISTEHNVVVTQPTSGDYRAFSATCTHAGCPVSSVSDGTINCACHGSKFSITDGSVRGGPAPAPLAEIPITLNGDSIEI